MSLPALSGALVGYAATAAARRLLERHPPGGAARWTRVNHRGGELTLLEGPAAAAGLVGALALAPALGSTQVDRRTRLAGVLAVGVAGGLGGYDDLLGSSASKGLRGHLTALTRGEVTTGAVKLIGIGATGLLCGAVLRRRPLDAVLAGGVIAGTANIVNLLDLRPGRALKASALAAAPLATGGRGALPAGAVIGTAAALLPEDLGERSMLGDAGANALGAAVGVAAAASLPRPALALALAGLVGLTLASERVSFTRVIESTPVLRDLDRLGRTAR